MPAKFLFFKYDGFEYRVQAEDTAAMMHLVSRLVRGVGKVDVGYGASVGIDALTPAGALRDLVEKHSEDGI